MKTILVNVYGNPKPVIAKVLREANGLAVTQTEKNRRDKVWEITHLPTGYKLTDTYGKRRKDVMAMLEFLANQFNWSEWTERYEAPEWARDARQAVVESYKIKAA